MNKFGPGLIVTAAFIGPGTITTASIAGANFGFALIWALVFSIITTIIFQEMAARLGIVSRQGLAEALRNTITRPWLKWPILLLIICAIGFGNAAYQTGNILGAAIGGSAITGIPVQFFAIAIALISAGLLASGTYKLIERVLISLVFVMGLVFVVAMFIQPPDFQLFMSQLIPTGIPDGSMLTIIALIGTTVVPYNLFLHANAVQQKWPATEDPNTSLQEARMDLVLSISLGGFVTFAIMITAATAFYGTGIDVNAAAIAAQLEPILGRSARYFVATGLFAAGLTSAITAPLAASYAVCGALGWPLDLKDFRFRLIWVLVILFGAVFAVAQTKPLTAILIAQAANGMLLPIIAISLLWVMNQPGLVGQFRNSVLNNLLAIAIILVTLGLGGQKLIGLICVGYVS
jgi:manganese transport protein